MSLTVNAVQMIGPLHLYRDIYGDYQIQIGYQIGNDDGGVFTAAGAQSSLIYTPASSDQALNAYIAAVNAVATTEGLSFSAPFDVGADTFIEWLDTPPLPAPPGIVTAPTITSQGAATVIGSTGAASIASGTDNSFVVQLIVNGTPPSVAGRVFTATYGTAFSGIPKVNCTIDLPSTSTPLQNVNISTGGAGVALEVLCSNVLSVGTYYFHFDVLQI